MLWMSKPQQQFFMAMFRLSPGNTRPWLTKDMIIMMRAGRIERNPIAYAQYKRWITDFLNFWKDQDLVRGGPGGKWRLTKKGKREGAKGLGIVE